jgi:hypothetical protein
LRFKLGLLIGFGLGWLTGKDVLLTFFQGLRKSGASGTSTGSGSYGSSGGSAGAGSGSYSAGSGTSAGIRPVGSAGVTSTGSSGSVGNGNSGTADKAGTTAAPAV